MPHKPKRPCAYPGCPELVDGRFCEKHAKQRACEYERYGRDPAARKRYDGAWVKIREAQLSAHPLCAECEKAGRLTPAQLVHHVIPLDKGGTNDPANLLSLCKACHSRLHGRDGSRWKNS